MPFVRAAFVSGELAKGVASKESDIDYVIVTAPDRLWICRTILILFKKLVLFNSKKFFCLNHFVSERQLEADRKNIYTAIEIATLKPLLNAGMLNRYLIENRWITDFLPLVRSKQSDLSIHKPSLLQRILEFFFRARFADRLDRRLMRFWDNLWIRRYPTLSEIKRRDLYRCTPDLSTAYAGDFFTKISTEYAKRLKDYGIASHFEIRLSRTTVDVLLTHSYFLRFDPKEHRAMMPYPPLGTLYAASYLRTRGFSVCLHDVMLAEREDEIIQSLEKHSPRILVIYDDQFNYLTKMCLSRMRNAAFTMTRMAKDRGCTVVIFSSDASDHLEHYFAHGADYVICGEAEETLAELVQELLQGEGKRIDLIAGLAYRHNGSFRRTTKRELLMNLDELPFPAWDLVDLERYRSVWIRRHGYFSLNLATTRGCPFHCNWCAKPIYGQVYHSRTPESVVTEMKFLKQVANPGHVWFADDIFGLKPGWITTFDEIVNRENAKIPFKCLSRVDLLLKEDNIHHLRNAGCQSVWVGAESGSQRILDAMEKGTTVRQIYEATALLRKAGIRIGFFLQFGYPGETKEDIEKTLKVVKDCHPDEIGISVSYPLPGTKFYDRVKAQLGEKQNWVDSQDLDLMFTGEYHPDFYRTLHRVVHKKFSVWRGLRTTKDVARARISRRSLRNLASMVYHGATLPLELRRLRQLEHKHVNGENH
jgi:radical SAM superfamily enzyme YgiQ (UPF0313 family)